MGKHASGANDDALLVEDERLAAVLDASPDAMVVVDADGRLVRVNPQAEELFGYAPGELDGEKLEVLLPVEARARPPAPRGVV